MSAQTLAGRNALLLGVERPAGRRTAVALAEAGASVAVVTLSEETRAEFAANSVANELWAMGVRGIALTSDGQQTSVHEAIADATVELGPISVVAWHAPPLPRDTLSGLRSDPAIVTIATADDPVNDRSALAAWTRMLADSGLRANAVFPQAHASEADAAGLRRHGAEQAFTLAQAVVHLASDETAALEGAMVVADG
jgi:hypothetical protein